MSLLIPALLTPPPAAGGVALAVESVTYVDNNTDTSSTSVSVPAAATFLVVLEDGQNWTTADNSILDNAITLGTGGGQILLRRKAGGQEPGYGDYWSIHCAYVGSLAGGSETFAWDHPGTTAADLGGGFCLVWIEGELSGQADPRDVIRDTDVGTGDPSVTLTITTTATDLVLARTAVNQFTPNIPSGTSIIGVTNKYNLWWSRLFERAGATTSVDVTQDAGWPNTTVGLSIKSD